MNDNKDIRVKNDQQSLPISKIKASEERIDELNVARLMKSIAKFGLLHPLTVSKDGDLIAGRHRLEALKRLGHTNVHVIRPGGVKSSKTSALLSIQENIARNQYSDLVLARMLQREKEILESLSESSSHGGTRTKGQKLPLESAVKSMSKEGGLSERSVRNKIAIAKKIPKELDKQLMGTELEHNQTFLERLSKLETLEAQKQLIESKLGSGEKATKRRRKRTNAIDSISSRMDAVGNQLRKMSSGLSEKKVSDQKAVSLGKKFDSLSGIWKGFSAKIELLLDRGSSK